MSVDTATLTLAYTLRELREEKGSTQEDLAHDAGITVTALSRIERGQVNPRWETIVSIAAALGVSLEELVAAMRRLSGSM